MQTILLRIYSFLWGPFSIAFIFGIGIFLSVRLGFVQIKHFLPSLKYVFKQLTHKKSKTEKGISPFQAVSTALAGTIGVGSLVGVSTAIGIGGPGAIFWMWVCAFFGMAIKFCEIYLSIQFRDKARKTLIGGPMFYIKNGLKNKIFAVCFSVFCLFSCFGMGNAVQSNALSVALNQSIHLNPKITGIILSFLVALVIFGGVKSIGKLNEKIVPFMAVFYFLCCIIVIVINIKNIPGAFAIIFKSAFGFREAGGGVFGFALSKTVSTGISKGIFINEAGLGTGSIAHGASSETDPIKEGYFGIFEVFITTFIIATTSAVALLCTGLWQKSDSFGIELTIKAFDSAMPYLGRICITVSTVFFSLSTILGWAYYGEVCLGFISEKISPYIFRFAYIIVIFFSSFSKIETVWLISEIFNGLMVYPNLISLLFLSGTVLNGIRKEQNKKIGVD